MSWLDKLERRFGKYAIKGLMRYIIGLNAIVFVLLQLEPRFISMLVLEPRSVMQGQVWRLFTYLFIPPESSIIFIVFVLYLYYMIGTTLEQEWGTFRFNVYYLIGMIGTTASVFLTGGIATAHYLNLSLFLAFAYLYPNFELLIFFFFPVKIKYLAYFSVAFMVFSFFMESLAGKVAVVVSIINFLIFFGKDIVRSLKMGRRNYRRKRAYVVEFPREYIIHRCEVCGRTEKDDKNLEFRYCVDCEGDHEYCMEHLHTHEHVGKKRLQ